MKPRKKPTLKQERFAQEYVNNGGNGTQAALQVYDIQSEDKDHTAGAIATENLSKPVVQSVIEIYKSKVGEIAATALKEAIQEARKMLTGDDNKLKLEALKCLTEVSKTLLGTDPKRIDKRNLNLNVPGR